MQLALAIFCALALQIVCGGAFAESALYRSCLASLEKDDSNSFCGGLVKGYGLGYTEGLLSISSTTSNGVVIGLHGTEIGGNKPFVFQPAGDDSDALVFVPTKSDASTTTKIGKGPYSFDLGKFSTAPLSSWLQDNSASVDVNKLEALQGALGEFQGDKPAIYEIPTLGDR